MSSAVMRIQVATLTDVPEGYGRIDGVPNQVVTLRSMGAGSTHEFRFFDVTNPGVAGGTVLVPAVPAIIPQGDGRTFTFAPPGGASGYGQSFGIELIVDRGLPTAVRSRHKYAIPTLNQQFILPLFSEGADPQASLFNRGTAQVANSCDNADGNWRGVHPRLLRWIAQLDQYLGRIELSPSPQALPAALAATTPVHVATVSLLPGTLYEIAADIGDGISGAEPTVLELRLQSAPFTTVATWAVTQLTQWTAHALALVITTEAAYEIYIHSQNLTGSWSCRALRLSTRI